MSKGKVRRPSIPGQVQRELWARAAGRCEFRGCNELLYLDDLTQKRSNLAVISHIVSYSPDGPRGDPVRSRALEKDIRNLMLTCRDHGKIIDDSAQEADYPEELLLEFKREHEQRVRMLTEAKDDAQTHVLLLQASIDARDLEIDPKAAFRAILPRYPAVEAPLIIDLSGVAIPANSEGFFPTMAESIRKETLTLLRRRPGGRTIRRLSVFALAPVPLLVHFGHVLGDIPQVDLYQRHRSSQDWTWKDEEAFGEFYETLMPESASDRDHNVALILSVSALVARDQVLATLGSNTLVYEIQAREPGPDFLSSLKRLEVFGSKVRSILGHLRDAHKDETVHLFAAVPAPAAIEFGRNIRGYHPTFAVYEYLKADRTYFAALVVNRR